MTRSARLNLTGWLLCSPALLVFGVFFLGPSLVGVWISLHEWNGSSPTMHFVGLGNYAALLDDARFWNAARVTLFALAVMLFIKLPLAIMLAAGLATPGRGKRVFRAVFFLPQVLSATVVAIIWVFMFDPYQGLINHLLDVVGLGGWQQGWLGQGDTAFPSLMVAAIWWTFGLYVVLFSAGIGRIPKEFYDVARLDTRSALHVLRHVTVPLLREQIFVAAVMTTGGVLGFLSGLFLLLTGGGPAGRTESLGLLGYWTAFRALQFGKSSAISVMVLVCVLAVIVGPTIRLARERLEY